MPFEISTTRRFAAAHALRLYDGSLEPVHGHNWRVRVTVAPAAATTAGAGPATAAGGLDAIGVVMDFHELERQVDAVTGPWHNRHLNEVAPFAGPAGLNPTAEHVALAVARGLRLPAGVRLVRVEVWETDDNRAAYEPA